MEFFNIHFHYFCWVVARSCCKIIKITIENIDLIRLNLKIKIKINKDLISKVKKLFFLKKESLNKLLDFEMEKVCKLLNEYKRPYRIITLNKCGEIEIGYLMMNFMLETITLAYLNNLNPFNQPATDKGKSINLK